MEIALDGKLCMMLFQQAEQILGMEGFMGLVGISENGKSHGKSYMLCLRKDAIFFLECCQYITIICTFAPKL